MATDYYLEIDGIDGESTDPGHKGEIEILSYSWGAVNPPAGGGATEIEDMAFRHRIDKASPKLMIACAQGSHHAIVELTASIRPSQDYMKVKLTDCIVSSVHQSGHGSDMPIEEFTINFATLQISYSRPKPDGSVGPTIVGGITAR